MNGDLRPGLSHGPDRGPILLLGASGQVGAEAVPLLSLLGPLVALTRNDLDLADAASLRSAIRQLEPRWIVNAAAYTSVDKAEANAGAAFILNRDVPAILGEEALRTGASVLHFSTDYVFAGDGTRPWTEDDPTHPLSVYGASKLDGEVALAASGAPHLIFRTSWVYGTRGKNFLLTILKLASERQQLNIVDDQFGAPTWSRTLAHLAADTILHTRKSALESGATSAEALQSISGIYHACAAGVTTWFGFASEFLEIAHRAHPRQAFAKLIPVPSSAYPTAATRPQNSRMNCEKLNHVLGFRMPAWQQSLSQVMDELLSSTQSLNLL